MYKATQLECNRSRTLTSWIPEPSLLTIKFCCPLTVLQKASGWSLPGIHRVSASSRALAGLTIPWRGVFLHNPVDSVKKNELAMMQNPLENQEDAIYSTCTCKAIKTQCKLKLQESYEKKSNHCKHAPGKEEEVIGLNTSTSSPAPSTSPAGASHWLNPNGSQRARGPLRQLMQISFLEKEQIRPGQTA